MRKQFKSLWVLTAIAYLVFGSGIEASAQDAPVEKTGQADCYKSASPWESCTCGTVNCQAGQDGDLEKGVAWPIPRFTDNGDGTVTDNLTGLVWMDDASCDSFGVSGQNTWSGALSDCNNLASGGCGITDGSSAGDWRLPNRKELQSLAYLAVHDPALSNAAGTGQWSEGDPFSDVQSSHYWSSSTYILSGQRDQAWRIFLFYGIESSYIAKASNNYVWCVRGGSLPDPPINDEIRPSSGSSSCEGCSPSLAPDKPHYDPGSDIYDDYITIQNISGSALTIPIHAELTYLTGDGSPTALCPPTYPAGTCVGSGGPGDTSWEYSSSDPDCHYTSGVSEPTFPANGKISLLWQFEPNGDPFEFWVDLYTASKDKERLGRYSISAGPKGRPLAQKGDGDSFIRDDGLAEIHTGSASGKCLLANRFTLSSTVSLEAVLFYTSGVAAGNRAEVIIYEDPSGAAPVPTSSMEIWCTNVVLGTGGFQSVPTAGCPILNPDEVQGAAFFAAVANATEKSYSLGIDFSGSGFSYISTDGGTTFAPLSSIPIIDGIAMIRAQGVQTQTCFINVVR